MTQEDCICHDAWDYNPNTLEVLMHGYRMITHAYLSSPTLYECFGWDP